MQKTSIVERSLTSCIRICYLQVGVVALQFTATNIFVLFSDARHFMTWMEFSHQFY